MVMAGSQPDRHLRTECVLGLVIESPASPHLTLPLVAPLAICNPT